MRIRFSDTAGGPAARAVRTPRAWRHLSRITTRLTVPALVAILVAGCGSASTQSSPSHDGDSTQTTGAHTLTPTGMDYPLADDSAVTVKDFSLGECKAINAGGFRAPCPLAGSIAAPQDDESHPVVMIVHGIHPTKSVYEKTYSGFNYLVQQLAAEGYVALSINMNTPYRQFDTEPDGREIGEEGAGEPWAYTIFRDHIAGLERANQGQEKRYGIDLTGKIDLSQIHLIAHSAGGDMTDLIMGMDRDKGLDRITSQIRVEATGYPGTKAPDVPVGVILGEFDGEVPDDGQADFDLTQADPARKSPISLTLLHGANHAQFNRMFTHDGLADDRPEAKTQLIPRAAQEDFLTHYAAAFLAVYAKGERPFGIFDPSTPEPTTMFTHPVTASYYQPGRQTLLDSSAKNPVSLSASGPAKVTMVTQGAKGVLFNHLGVSYSHPKTGLPLYDIRWTASGGSVTIPFDAQSTTGASISRDLSHDLSLSLYLAVDSSDALNPHGINQSLTVSLKDAHGKERSVVVPKSTTALTYYPGHVVAYKGEAPYWDGGMPLGELRIPLSDFDGIDLSSVTQAVLGLDQTTTGAIMLSGVYTQPQQG